MDPLQGKTAFVTGAGSGIGAASARRLAADGAQVTVSDLDGAAAEAIAARIRKEGGRADHVVCDVTKEADVAALVAHVVENHGRLDIAHNNAGWEGPLGRLPDINVDDFDRVLAINLRGVFLGLKHAIPAMVAQGGGSIINTSSVAGLVANQGAAAYSAAKHGVIGLTKTAAAEWARKGVRVNAVCPGWTDTPMAHRTGDAAPKVMDMWTARVPAGRLGEADEIAGVVAFLASDASHYLNGAAIPVDGGWTAV